MIEFHSMICLTSEAQFERFEAQLLNSDSQHASPLEVVESQQVVT